jgi:hypothetical protein
VITRLSLPGRSCTKENKLIEVNRLAVDICESNSQVPFYSAFVLKGITSEVERFFAHGAGMYRTTFIHSFIHSKEINKETGQFLQVVGEMHITESSSVTLTKLWFQNLKHREITRMI